MLTGAGTSDNRCVKPARSRATAKNSGLSSGSAVDAPRGSRRILLVEDNADLRELLTFVLESEGYEVDAVDGADEGLALLHTTRYGLILTDYALPRRNGHWLLQQAEAAGLLADTSAVIVTAHPSVPDARWRVVRKPVDVDTFVQTVRSLIQ